MLQVGYIALITSLGICEYSPLSSNDQSLNFYTFANKDAAYVSLPNLARRTLLIS